MLGSDYPHLDSRFPHTIATIGLSDFFRIGSSARFLWKMSLASTAWHNSHGVSEAGSPPWPLVLFPHQS